MSSGEQNNEGQFTGRNVYLKNLAQEVLNLLTSGLVGTDQQVLQFNGTVLTSQNLILGSKQIDNTVVPTDGQVLTYDNASGKVKFKTISSSALSEVQWLASQSV